MNKLISHMEMLAAKEVHELNNGVLEVLEKVGMRYESDHILKALEAFGAKINLNDKSAKFPPDVIGKIMSAKKLESPPVELDEKLTPTMDLTIEPFYYDFDRKVRRQATTEDFKMLIKFGEAMNGYFKTEKRVSPPVCISDVDRNKEPFEALELLFKYVRKPGKVYVYCAEQMPCLAKIGEVYMGDQTYFLGTGWLGITSPLIMGEHTAKMLMKNIEYGVKSRIGTMVIAGGNAPVTVAGAIVMAAAEIVGGWAAILSLKPDAILSASVVTGTMDMRTAKACFSSPEAHLQNMGVHELLKKCYGVEAGISAVGYIDAKLPGLQAVFEKTSKVLLSSAFINRPFVLANGELDAGMMYSPVELLLEHELGSQLYRYNQGIEVNRETMALEVIKEVVTGTGKNFLGTEHTLANYKKTWMPSFIDRSAYGMDEAEHRLEKELLYQANERFKYILNSYRSPVADEKIVKEIRKIVRGTVQR